MDFINNVLNQLGINGFQAVASAVIVVLLGKDTSIGKRITSFIRPTTSPTIPTVGPKNPDDPPAWKPIISQLLNQVLSVWLSKGELPSKDEMAALETLQKGMSKCCGIEGDHDHEAK